MESNNGFWITDFAYLEGVTAEEIREKVKELNAPSFQFVFATQPIPRMTGGGNDMKEVELGKFQIVYDCFIHYKFDPKRKVDLGALD